jgi:hypothetical protein
MKDVLELNEKLSRSVENTAAGLIFAKTCGSTRRESARNAQR